MSNLLVNQPAGLGDIMFLQTLVKNINFSKVYWPVYDHYLDDCNTYLSSEKVTYISNSSPALDNGDLKFDGVANFDKSHLIHKTAQKSFMYSKYEMLGLDPSMWMLDFKYSRDSEKESNLFNKVVKQKKYKLINLGFGSSPESKFSENTRSDLLSKFSNDDSAVFLEPVEGFSLFDWSKVIEHADEIHTVETSLVYLVEYLQTTDKLFMYLKGSKESFLTQYDGWDYICRIHNKNWEYEAL
tara:strand:- start:4040 stop:4762 length:723 start_codon:yes stop_codon:yes gene_type:complete